MVVVMVVVVVTIIVVVVAVVVLWEWGRMFGECNVTWKKKTNQTH